MNSNTAAGVFQNILSPPGWKLIDNRLALVEFMAIRDAGRVDCSGRFGDECLINSRMKSTPPTNCRQSIQSNPIFLS